MYSWLWDHFKKITGLWFVTLFTKLPSFVGRVLSVLGISIFGFSYALPKVKELLSPYIFGLPSGVLNYIVYLNIDKGIILVLSAYAVRISNHLVWGKSA
jgi:hypothetical protein